MSEPPEGGSPHGGDGGASDEELEEGDFPFLRADHPAYKRLQEAWKKQLTQQNERVSLQLRERNEELKKLTKYREDVGVTLYGAQQQLAKLQLQLEQLHDRYAIVHGQRLQDDEALKQVTEEWEGKKRELEEGTRRLGRSQEELNQLNMTLRQVGDYNEQMKAEIQVTRRATYKAEDHIRQIEKVKQKQDLLIDRMNEDVKQLTQQKALLDAQLIAQKQESEAAATALREAGKEMEAIEFEKKQLMAQWRSSLLGVQRRDEAMQNVQQALQEQAEAELSIENEIRGLQISIRQEQERHEQLCSLRDRNEKEMQYLQSQMANIKQEREKLLDQFNILKKTMDGHIEETQQLKAAIKDGNHQLEAVERGVQNVSRDVTALAGKIDSEESEQVTSDRVAANSRKRIAKVQEEIAQKEVETQSLHNEIARVTVDSLNTKAHNQMLRDRHKQLSEELAERERLVEQYEQEIRKRHHQIEKKQLYVDRLNREYDDKRTKLELEDGDADVAGPQEAKLKHMKKAITDLTKQCTDMQKDWIQKQTQLLSISTETDRIKAALNDQQNKKLVLEQKKIRIEGQLQAQKKEIKELENAMRHLRFDMDRMNGALVKHDGRSRELANSNQMLEAEFVQKLKEIESQCLDMERSVERVKDEKDTMTQEILEAERQVLLWERKITLEKEMQEALDPNIGQADSAAMKKEIHRMELRLDQLKRRQEQMIVEMERAIYKRDAIALKFEPKAKKSSKSTTSAANLKRQVQSLRNNLKLCTQANAEAEQRIAQREGELARLQRAIEQHTEDYAKLEQSADSLRSDVQAASAAKQRRLSALLRLQRTAKRLDELSTGTGPPPSANVFSQLSEQRATRDKVADVLRVLHDAYPQLEHLWGEFYQWLQVAPG